MGFPKLFKRKVPKELPDLAADEIEKSLEAPKKDNEIVSNFLKREETPLKPIPAPISTASNLPSEDDGFFSQLQENITKEITDLDKLEKWYNHQFLPQDIVSGMKNYWDDQKSTVNHVLGRNFKEKISEKIANLQKLEKEWQGTYFDLVEKEEKIRDEERELKKVLAEFVDICKKRSKTRKRK